jgi:hypothetical protein
LTFDIVGWRNKYRFTNGRISKKKKKIEKKKHQDVDVTDLSARAPKADGQADQRKASTLMARKTSWLSSASAPFIPGVCDWLTKPSRSSLSARGALHRHRDPGMRLRSGQSTEERINRYAEYCNADGCNLDDHDELDLHYWRFDI